MRGWNQISRGRSCPAPFNPHWNLEGEGAGGEATMRVAGLIMKTGFQAAQARPRGFLRIHGHSDEKPTVESREVSHAFQVEALGLWIDGGAQIQVLLLLDRQRRGDEILVFNRIGLHVVALKDAQGHLDLCGFATLNGQGGGRLQFYKLGWLRRTLQKEKH